MRFPIIAKGQYVLVKDYETYIIVEDGSDRETFQDYTEALNAFNKIPDGL